MSFYREQLEAYLKTLDIEADKVLDIGGSAYPIVKRVKSWQVNEYMIMDNGNEENFHEKWVKPYLFVDINKEYRGNLADKFDVIFCLEVAEYLYNPLFAIMSMYKYLKEKGALYMSFPFVYPWHQPIFSDYLRYTRAGVMKLLTEAGFKMEKIGMLYRVDRSGTLEEFHRADGMRGAKGERHDVTGYIVKAIK